ncbi:MAG TPA: glyoxalase [Actinoplanes sp.]|nr:glyoxalase [Actinoplanes sp.]
MSNETIIPLLHCTDPEATREFWQAMGFRKTWDQQRPYVYLAFEWEDFALHYGSAPDGLDPAREHTGGCLVMVDAVAPYHARFTESMRAAYGKVPAKGLPRITRFRAEASRFTVMDPNGNSIVFIRRDEPQPEYGGSAQLTGLAKVLDNARVLREFKTDDKAAFRALNSGLRRHAESATGVERATALAALIELSTVLGEPERVPEWGTRLREITLTPEETTRVTAFVADPELVEPWLRS